MTDDVLNHISASTASLNAVAKSLQAIVDDIPKKDLTEAAVFFFHLKDTYTALDSARKAVNAQLEALNKHVLPTMMEDAGVDKFQVPTIARSFYPLTKTSCSMIDRDAGMKWLRDRGAGSLISETVNAGTLAAYMKDIVVNEGVDPPEDIFKLSTYKTTGISKYTPKG